MNYYQSITRFRSHNAHLFLSNEGDSYDDLHVDQSLSKLSPSKSYSVLPFFPKIRRYTVLYIYKHSQYSCLVIRSIIRTTAARSQRTGLMTPVTIAKQRSNAGLDRFAAPCQPAPVSHCLQHNHQRSRRSLSRASPLAAVIRAAISGASGGSEFV